MSTHRKAVLAVGAVMVDILCDIRRLPLSGQGVVADNAEAVVGGCAFNSANVIRQLGVPHVLFAPLGMGIFADYANRLLAAHNLAPFDIPLDAQTARRDNGGCICNIEPGGERTMITIPGIERHYDRTWFDTLDTTQIGSGFISGYEVDGQGGDAIISFFEDHPQIALTYAPGPCIAQVGSEKTARINALHPIWHLNDLEALSFTGASDIESAGFSIARDCGNAVIITAGSQGAHFFDEGAHRLVPTRPVSCIDTVGAGDAHLGALMAARTAGHDWESALRLANDIAGAVCERRGSTLPDELFASRGWTV